MGQEVLDTQYVDYSENVSNSLSHYFAYIAKHVGTVNMTHLSWWWYSYDPVLKL